MLASELNLLRLLAVVEEYSSEGGGGGNGSQILHISYMNSTSCDC